MRRGTGRRWTRREVLGSLAVGAPALMAASSCGGGGDQGAPGGGATRYRFAVMPKSLDLPVFSYAKVGAERAAKELGISRATLIKKIKEFGLAGKKG